jgi:hypothetical protein
MKKLKVKEKVEQLRKKEGKSEREKRGQRGHIHKK